MDLKIFPSKLKGVIEAPPSKSITHRYLICAALSPGKSIIKNPLISEDTIATIEVLKTLGAKFKLVSDHIIVKGTSRPKRIDREITILESATTLRVLLPILVLFSKKLTINSSKRLIDRIYTSDLFSLNGLHFQRERHKITIKGTFLDEEIKLSGRVTTQLISGVLVALPFLKENVSLVIEDTNFSNPYIALTIDAMRRFGVNLNIDNNRVKLGNVKKYIKSDQVVEGDFSNGAVWLVAAYFHPELSVKGLNPASLQGDRKIIDFFNQMNVVFVYVNDKYTYKEGRINNAKLDIFETPDLAPILVALTSIGDSRVVITGTNKLKHKESDRKLAIMEVVNSLGGNVKLEKEDIVIQGKNNLQGDSILESYNDHRIVMASAILATISKKPVTIKDFRAVDKSYPNFFKDLASIGASFEVI